MGCCRVSNRQHLILDAGDDLELHVSESGTGPPVLLLHGFTGSAETWKWFRSKLDQSYRVVALDLPGHGQSSSPRDPRRYALSRLSDDIARVLDLLNVPRVVLAGYSMGGRASLNFALSHPDRAAGLILESSSPGITDDSLRRERVKSDEELASLIEREGLSAFVTRWESLPLWESQSRLPEITVQSLRNQRLANNPVGLANSLRGAGAAADAPVHDRLSSISCPALIVAGELDTKYVEIGRMLAASIPDARLSIVPDAGHAVHLERPASLLTEISQFLGSLGSEGDRWM